MNENPTEYVVMTANPDLTPLLVYEIERGVYPNLNMANAAARSISRKEHVAVQIFARQLRMVSIPMHEPYTY